MRHIQKGSEPVAFTKWKTQGDANWNPGWEDFDGRSIKQAVKQALLVEQGYLCCYCEDRVCADRDDNQNQNQFDKKRVGHIEHIEARHKHPDLALAYENMVYSCGETDKGKPTTCGHARKPDDPVPVSPLQPDCESRFVYTVAGKMLPRKKDDFDARDTIRILNLNESLLRRFRAVVYQAIADGHRELSPDQFRHWLALELQRDTDNMLNPFWSTKRYVAETLCNA